MKKRMISLMLSIALVATLVPVDSVKAAEINELEQIESDAVSEFMKDYQIYNVDGKQRVVGNNGTAYDEITYLSVDAVQSLDDEKREAYVDLCDGIASWIEGGYELERAVIAVDNNGDLNWYWSVPVGELGHFQNKLSADLPAVENLWEDTEIQDTINTAAEELDNTETEHVVQGEDTVGIAEQTTETIGGNENAFEPETVVEQ